MPPRSGQLDAISQAIGRLEGQIEGIETYIHDKRHEDKNVSQKIDGLGLQIGKDIAKVEARLEAKVDGFITATNNRLAALERDRERQTGAKNLATSLLHSPVIAWIFAMAVAAWTYFKGSGR